MAASSARCSLSGQLHVLVPFACLVETSPGCDLGPDLVLRLADLVGNPEDVLLASGRNHDHAVGVSDQNVAGVDPYVSERHADVVAVGLDATASRPHRHAAAEDGVAELEAAAGVAADAMDDGSRQPVAVRRDRQDVAPNRAIEATAVVKDHNTPGRDIIDVLADGASAPRDRDRPQSVSPSRQPKAAVEGGQTQSLTGDSQAVEGIAERARRVVS